MANLGGCSPLLRIQVVEDLYITLSLLQVVVVHDISRIPGQCLLEVEL